MKNQNDALDMKKCLKIIEEFDEYIEMLNEKWAEEITALLATNKYKDGSEKQEKAIEKINKKFNSAMIDVISTRDSVYEYALGLQDSAFEKQFEEEITPDFSKVDENGRPIGYIRVHGKWQKRKKK